ncbi:hypothetical protein [Oceaniglobus trochenteri]|uniref:hypothetical protein n=1 Tax=Oceaniglobus trochenteri TaxID=2763260 RepID=UPI001CFFEADC|nr:hypothetical protein [Oceaniglobus trochenteri]
MISEQTHASGGNDYHRLPASEKQLRFALQIAQRLGRSIPADTRQDRRALSRWIDENRGAAQAQAGRFSHYPTSKQVAFAEKIARLKRRNVPDECFRDKGLMSRWIDSNT